VPAASARMRQMQVTDEFSRLRAPTVGQSGAFAAPGLSRLRELTAGQPWIFWLQDDQCVWASKLVGPALRVRGRRGSVMR
jgi:hypothetical protein